MHSAHRGPFPNLSALRLGITGSKPLPRGEAAEDAEFALDRMSVMDDMDLQPLYNSSKLAPADFQAFKAAVDALRTRRQNESPVAYDDLLQLVTPIVTLYTSMHNKAHGNDYTVLAMDYIAQLLHIEGVNLIMDLNQANGTVTLVQDDEEEYTSDSN